MNLRRIQKTCGGTFFVCLPKVWAQKNYLDKGSVVSLSETVDGNLIVNPKYNIERKLKEIVITPSSLLDRVIIEKYLLGYDIIKVNSKQKIRTKDRQRVKEASIHLIGLEIVEESNFEIVMQCLLEPSSFPPQKILRREYSIVSGMHKDVISALIAGDLESAKNVIARDIEVNRLYFLLVRILRTIIQNPRLSEKLGVLPINCLDYRLAASLVESIGDYSSSIGEIAIKLNGIKINGIPSELILKLHKSAFESHEKAINAIYYRDVTIAESVRSVQPLIEKTFQDIQEAIIDLSTEIGHKLLAAASLICQIYENSLDIADLVMFKLP